MLSLCITTYNRFELTVKSFEKVIDDDRISDIVVLDDASTDGSYEQLFEYFKGVKKVRVIRQIENRGMSVNKKDAIAYAKEDWAIIFDSDNVIGKDYLDALEETPDLFEDPSEIFMPDFAKPNFNYGHFSALSFGKINIKQFVTFPMFGSLMNTCNYVVNRYFYLDVWQYNPAMKGSDTIWHALQHLKGGGGFYIVPGMQYEHLVHDGSGFRQDMAYNMDKAMEIENQIKNL